MIDYNLLKGKIAAMQSTEPEYAFHFLNNAQNPSTEWGCIEDMLDSMEVYEAEPMKHGKWNGYICSECNVCADYFISGDFYFDEKPNFCPNCGARMDLKDGDKK